MKSGRFQKTFDCIGAIKNGQVTVNNKIIANPSYFFNPKKDLIKLNNKKLKTISKLYFIMNKPSGFLSQKSNEEKNIYELLNNLNLPKEAIQSLHAVGRLDKGTEGLIILTNDGNLSSIIANPENKMQKRYRAVLEKPLDKSNAREMEKGVRIEMDGEQYTTKPCRIKIVGENEAYITITEGKKRQIRKMFKACGNNVVSLKRISIGGLEMGSIKAGEFSRMSREQIMEKLFQ